MSERWMLAMLAALLVGVVANTIAIYYITKTLKALQLQIGIVSHIQQIPLDTHNRLDNSR